MSNYNHTKDEIKNNLIARVPLLIVRSAERERVERMLRQLAAEMRIDIFYYTDVRQVVSLGSGVSKDVERDPLSFVQDTFRKKRGATFVLGDARRIGEENSFSREVLDTLYLAMDNNCTLVLVTPDYVWNRLAQFGMLVSLDYPDAGEREAQIRRFVERFGSKYPVYWDAADIYRASMLLRGFTEVQIENILSSTLVSAGQLGADQLVQLTTQKSRLYAAVPCVDEVRLPESVPVAGLENLREWLSLRKDLFFLSDDILKSRGITTPRGILLAGIPGCGKSLSARMVAKEWGLPLFRFDIGGIYDKWVGESERKMRAALTFIDNVAPCVVWIDEIEKALAVSDSGNDTGRRILGQFLFWLQESSGRVFLVATANDISRLPAELFRKGRFSEIFFIDLPDRAERRSALAQYMDRCLTFSVSDADMEELVDLTENFSYSDMEESVKQAAQLDLIHPERPVTIQDLKEILKGTVSFATANPEIVADLRKWGKERAVPASRIQTSQTV